MLIQTERAPNNALKCERRSLTVCLSHCGRHSSRSLPEYSVSDSDRLSVSRPRNKVPRLITDDRRHDGKRDDPRPDSRHSETTNGGETGRDSNLRPMLHAPHSPRPRRIPLRRDMGHRRTETQRPDAETGKEERGESVSEGQSMQPQSQISLRFKPSQFEFALWHRGCRILRRQIRSHFLSLLNYIRGSSTPPEAPRDLPHKLGRLLEHTSRRLARYNFFRRGLR